VLADGSAAWNMQLGIDPPVFPDDARLPGDADARGQRNRSFPLAALSVAVIATRRRLVWRACHICAGTGLNSATSAPGLGSTLPHLRRDWAQLCHICTGTGLNSATSAPGLGSTLPHLRRDWAQLCHICAGTGLNSATSAPGLGSTLLTLPHLRQGPHVHIGMHGVVAGVLPALVLERA
jgi:hypothetical protein